MQAKKNERQAAKRAQELAIKNAKRARKEEKVAAAASQYQSLVSRTAVLEAESKLGAAVATQVDIARTQSTLMESQHQQLSLIGGVLTEIKADAARRAEADARRDSELVSLRQNQFEMTNALQLMATATRENTSSFLHHLQDRDAEHSRQLQLRDDSLKLRDQALQQLTTEFTSGQERRDVALRASQESFGTFLQQQQSVSHGFFRQHLQDQGQQFLVTQQHNLEKFVSYLQLHNGVVSDITTHQAVLDNMQKVLISLLTKQPALTDESPGAGVLSRRLASTAAAPTFTSQLRQPADTERR